MKKYFAVVVVAIGLLITNGTVAAHETGAPHVEVTSVNTAEITSLNSQLINATKSSGMVQTRSANPTASASLRTVAEKRKKSMKELAEKNPALFIKYAIPTETRAKLPADIQNLVEAKTTVTGKVNVVHVDDFQHPEKSYFQYSIQNGGSKVNLKSAVVPAISSGSIVRVQGIQLDSTLVTPGAANIVTTAAAPAPALTSVGNQRTAIILVDFPDSGARPFTAAEVKNDIFNGKFQKYYKEQSYNQTWFTGEVFGWYKLSRAGNTDSGYPVCGQLSPEEIGQITAANNINLNNYDRLVVVASHPYMGGGCSGVGKQDLIVNGISYNLSVAWVAATSLTDPYGTFSSYFDYVMAHEIGHSLGVNHANAWGCVGSIYPMYGDCSHVEYGNEFDVMGRGNTSGHFNAYYKELLGWIKPANTLTITSSGRYTLNALELEGGKQLAKIKTPGSAITPYYYIEERKPIGFDAKNSFPSVFTNGLLTNQVIVPLSDSPTYTFSRLIQASSFSDPGRGVTIDSIQTVGTSSVSFNVKLAPSVCVKSAPATSDINFGNFSAGMENFIWVGLINMDSPTCASSRFNISAKVPQGWTSTSGMSDVLTVSGGFGGASVGITPPPTATGENRITLTITNQVTGLKRAFDAFVIVVKQPTINTISPNQGVVGDQFTISGTNLITEGGVNTVSFGAQLASIVSLSPTSVVARVPQVNQGIYYVSVSNNGTQSNGMPFTVLSTTTPSRPTITVNPNPSLKLQYDSTGKESSLVATYGLTITAGATDAIINKNGFIINGLDTSGHGVGFSSSLTSASTDIIDNQTYYTIPAGKKVVATVVGQVQDLQHIFGGVYTAQLVSMIVDNDYNHPFELTAPKTNPVTIIGEVSPYITAVSTPVAANGTLSVTGVRLGTTNTVTLFSKINSTVKTLTGASTNGTTINIPLNSTVPLGIYNLQVTHPTTGTSNGMAVEIIKATGTTTGTTTPTQTIARVALINANTDRPFTGYEDIKTGLVINLAKLPSKKLNIQAFTSPNPVGSVKFTLTGAETKNHLENGGPYSLIGNTGADFYPWTPKVGSYTLIVTPYTKQGATGVAGTATTIQFRVINSTSTPAASPETPATNQSASPLKAVQSFFGTMLGF